MKKIALPSVSLCLAALASPVHAQSTVTLYGVIDTGLTYVHNSGGQSTQLALGGGALSGSRWGLKGSEDLGNGLKAVFRLENGFNPTTGALGQGSRMFGRQAYVGLSDDKFGTLTLGRQYDPIVDQVQPLTGDNYFGAIIATPGDFDNYDNSIRINNSVKWVSPSWSGLTVEALYSFGGVAGSVGSGQTYSASVAYNTGAFGIAAGYMHLDYGNTGLVKRPTSSADSLFNSSVNSAYASARSVNSTRVAGQYVLGSVTLGAGYSFTQYNPDAASAFLTAEKYQNASVFGVWQVAPTFLLGAGYNYTKTSGDSSAKYHMFTVGADYNLSKRTDVYAVAGYTHASGQNGLGEAQAVVGSYDIDSGKTSQAITVVGLRHRF
ncbi:Porin Gram-negative type [Paraburkholderia piptadeniae]|uniref:Porin n=2 Tax=Paraburkholderia TaxID=1822464 RepID=A0A7X1NF74_9BURK|nr:MULTISPECIES: porin [Paraburkholderia]MPW20421.1 porin [Paraburkholderia franconis]SIT50944.1 Porin Gram-negative type [Paraburkholderia piptadeniae]